MVLSVCCMIILWVKSHCKRVILLKQQFPTFLIAHKLISKIPPHTKNIFCWSYTKNRYNLDSFTPSGYCCVSCCHTFIEKLREKSVPLTKESDITCFKNYCTTVENHCPKEIHLEAPYIFMSSIGNLVTKMKAGQHVICFFREKKMFCSKPSQFRWVSTLYFLTIFPMCLDWLVDVLCLHCSP